MDSYVRGSPDEATRSSRYNCAEILNSQYLLRYRSRLGIRDRTSSNVVIRAKYLKVYRKFRECFKTLNCVSCTVWECDGSPTGTGARGGNVPYCLVQREKITRIPSCSKTRPIYLVPGVCVFVCDFSDCCERSTG